MISVAACAGDASAMAASATNCKNLKTNFTGGYPALRRRRNICPLPLINPRGCGFNPPGTHRSAQHKFKLQKEYEDYLPNTACQSSHQ
jgi:hypothetical protein